MASWAETVAAAALNDGSSYSNAASSSLSNASDTLDRYIQGQNKTVELSKSIVDELVTGTKDITTALGEEAMTDIALAGIEANKQSLANKEFVAKQSNQANKDYEKGQKNLYEQLRDKSANKLGEITQYRQQDNQQQTQAPANDALQNYLDNREWINPGGNDLSDIGNRIIQRYKKDQSVQDAITPIKNEQNNARIGLSQATVGPSAQTTISANAIMGRVIDPVTGQIKDFTHDKEILRKLGINDGDSVLSNIDPEKVAEYIVRPDEAQKARDTGALLPIQYHAILFLANDKNALAYARETIDYQNKLKDTLEGYITDYEDAMRYVDILLDDPKMADLYRFTTKKDLAHALLQQSLKNKSATTQEQFGIAKTEKGINTMYSPVSEGSKVDEKNKQSGEKGTEPTHQQQPAQQTPTPSPKVKPEVPNSGRSTSSSAATTNTNMQTSQEQVANQNNVNASSVNNDTDANSNDNFIDPTIPEPAQKVIKKLTDEEKKQISIGYNSVLSNIMNNSIRKAVSQGQPTGYYEFSSPTPLKEYNPPITPHTLHSTKPINFLANNFTLKSDKDFSRNASKVFLDDPVSKHIQSVSKALNKTSISESPDKLLESLAREISVDKLNTTISEIDKLLFYIDNKYKNGMPEDVKHVRENWSNYRNTVSSIKEYKELNNDKFNATSVLGEGQLIYEQSLIKQARKNIEWANNIINESNKEGGTVTGDDGSAVVMITDKNGNKVSVKLSDAQNVKNIAQGDLIAAKNNAFDAINGGAAPDFKVEGGDPDPATNLMRNINYEFYNILTGETVKSVKNPSQIQSLPEKTNLSSIPAHIVFNVVSRYIEPTQENINKLLGVIKEIKFEDKFATKDGAKANSTLTDIIDKVQKGISDKGIKIKGGTLLLSADTNEINLIKQDINDFFWLVTEDAGDGKRKYYPNNKEFMKKAIYKGDIDAYNKDDDITRMNKFGWYINNNLEAFKSQYDK